MKRKTVLYLLALIVFVSFTQTASALEPEWVRTYLPINVNEPMAFSVDHDSQGNAYIGGTMINKTNWNRDIVLVKYDSSGNELWAKRYSEGYSPRHYAARVIVDGDDNAYIVGNGNEFRHFFLAKHSPDGSLLWMRRFNSDTVITQLRSIDDLFIDSAGNLYVLSTCISSRGGWRYEALILKYDKEGNLLWQTLYGSPYRLTFFRDIEVDSAGNLYATGIRNLITTIKLDSFGNLLWERDENPEHTGFSPYSVSIALDSARNVYLTSGWGSNLSDLKEMVTLKYDTNGALQWKHSKTDQEFIGFEIETDSNDDIIAVGFVTDLGLGQLNKSCNYCHQGGVQGTNNNMVTTKYDTNGNVIWEREDKFAPLEAVGDLNIGSDGRIYVSGVLSDGIIKLSNIIFDTNGQLVDWNSYAHHDRNSALTDATITNDGIIYVSGILDRGLGIVKYDTVQNSSPTANAGADKTVECGNVVSLDGSGSTDPDGDVLTYTWTGTFGTATGVNATVTLPLGTHTVTLTVDDGNGGTDADDVVIIIADTTPPSTSAIISGTEGNNGWYTSVVTVELSSADNCSEVAELSYSVNGATTTVSGGSATVTLGEGTNTLNFFATDGLGNVESTRILSADVDVTSPEITITGVEDGALYPSCMVPEAGYDATDAVSGVAASSDSLTSSGAGIVQYTYSVSAEDNAGNTADAGVTYEVIGSSAGLVDLIRQYVAAGLIAPQMENSLVSQVQNGAIKAFINHVEAQSGKKIDPAAAVMLVNAGSCL